MTKRDRLTSEHYTEKQLAGFSSWERGLIEDHLRLKERGVHLVSGVLLLALAVYIWTASATQMGLVAATCLGLRAAILVFDGLRFAHSERLLQRAANLQWTAIAIGVMYAVAYLTGVNV